MRQECFVKPIMTPPPPCPGSAIHTGAIECVTKKDRLMTVLLNEHAIAEAQRVLMRIEAGWPGALSEGFVSRGACDIGSLAVGSLAARGRY
jgi:hypothetical protein